MQTFVVNHPVRMCCGVPANECQCHLRQEVEDEGMLALPDTTAQIGNARRAELDQRTSKKRKRNKGSTAFSLTALPML